MSEVAAELMVQALRPFNGPRVRGRSTMAWGLANPLTFGQTSPQGNFVGWDEALIAHYVSVTPAETVAELKAIGETAFLRKASVLTASEASLKFHNGHEALEQQEQPREFRLVKTPSELASLLEIKGGLLVVDLPLKTILEELEPGVHQFWPIKLTLPKDREFPKPYFGINVMQHRDSLILDQSDVRASEVVPDRYSITALLRHEFQKIALSRERIGSAHLWRETKLSSPALFISDHLQKLLAKRDMKIWKHYPVREL